MQDTVTIEQALDAFVEDQRQRLSARTMRGYDDVVELLRHSLNGYGPNALDQAEHRRWEKVFDSGDEEAFCHLFGPERILGHLSEFLGYFMVRKVIAGQELLRSAGTVTKRLAEWLYQESETFWGRQATNAVDLRVGAGGLGRGRCSIRARAC